MAEILQESFDQKINDAQKTAQDVSLFLKNNPDDPPVKDAGKKSVNAVNKATDSTKKVPEVITVKDEEANADDIAELKKRIEQAKKDAAAKRAQQTANK